MPEWAVQVIIAGLVIPLLLFFIKMHADLVYRTVPDGFRMLRAAFEHADKEQRERHDEAMELWKRFRREQKKIKKALETESAQPNAKPKIKRRTPRKG